MEKKVLLKKLVEEGRHIRKEFTPTAIVSDFGSRPIGEFWDANKTVDVIVNGAHAVHDTVREVDEYTHGEIDRLNKDKVGRIGYRSNDKITDITALTNAQIDKLSVGDTVIKGNHSYVVAYKKENEMSLVYTDHETIEEVYYEKQNGNWTHIVTDSFQPQEKLVSGQNIATVGGQNLLEGGNVVLPTIPTDVSAFNNDAGYLTSHQDLTSLEQRIAALEAVVLPNNAEE